MTHKGGRLLSTLVCFLFSYLTLTCDVSYSTLKNAEMRGSQLGVPTIERICVALGVTLSDFFAESGT